MCSIMGYCGCGVTLSAFRAGFAETVLRGPDESRVTDTGRGLLGFHRLAIMGLSPKGMQPFELDGSYAVCNGEIYGFRQLREQLSGSYTFRSGSDCEVLLPLYRQYGTDMFRMLDAEFALILYDAEADEYIAARDPIGIRPLYYGYDRAGVMVLASEPRCLTGLCERVLPFPPGYYWRSGRGGSGAGTFVCYEDISSPRSVCRDGLEEVCRNIREKLIAGIRKRLDADAPVGFLLSGGLDSSLVCAVAARQSRTPIRTFAIGMDTDAIDLKYARQVADYIGSIHTEVIMTKQQVVGILPELVRVLGTYDITTVRASVGMYLLCRWIHEHTDIRVLLTGEISDELFGYKYTDFAPSAAAFQAESEKRVRDLHMYDVLRADRCISENSLEARVPFGDLDFVRYVLSVDPALKLNVYGKGKYLLRHAFAGGWLPQEILYREKAAFSDAVGHSMVDDLKEYAAGRYSDADFTAGCLRYTENPPFTKESLLYRDLFEVSYPGQAALIPGFWMPNPAWEGCRVSDPSARVLSNYGDSGK